MFADRRRLLIGGAIVAVLVLAGWLLMSPAAPAASSAVPPARARAAQTTPGGGVVEQTRPVKLDELAASTKRAEPDDTSRNPFRFEAKAPAPPPPRPVATPTPPGTGAEVLRPPMPTAPSGPPPPPPIPLKFIGVVERANGVKWAVLSDGRVTLHGRDGDIIDGRYRIVKIGTESIEITYVDGRGRQTVRLTGQ